MTDLVPAFQYNATLFGQIMFKRPPQIDGSVEIPIKVEVKIVDNAELPKRLQVNILVTSDNPRSISFTIEAIGIFDYVENDVLPTKKQKIDFIRYRGLHIVWASVRSMVRRMTVDMGMNPLDLQTPKEFDLDQLEKEYLG